MTDEGTPTKIEHRILPDIPLTWAVAPQEGVLIERKNVDIIIHQGAARIVLTGPDAVKLLCGGLMGLIEE